MSLKNNFSNSKIQLLNIDSILCSIHQYEFECFRCGSCCIYNKKFDNTVYIRYDEIIAIEKYYNIPFKSIVDPFIPDILKYKVKNKLNIKKYLKSINNMIDKYGNIHTKGWKIKRRNNGDCIFYDRINKKCNIYIKRPSLCFTYPFYIDLYTCELNICKCNYSNIKKNITSNYSRSIKKINYMDAIIKRYFDDINDIKNIKTNSAHMKNINFNIKNGFLNAYKNFLSGYLSFVVYDQNSTSKITMKVPISLI